MFSLNDIRTALGDALLFERPGEAASFAGISNDSRVAKPGELFVALKTEVRDGHDFVQDAVAHGATGVIVQREDIDVPEGVSVFRVEDTAYALGEIARFWRASFPELHCVVVAGNYGKTTTKELTAGLLAGRYNVLKSYSNFNDNVGVAISVLGLRSEHQVLVQEVGMDHLGEIRRSCEIAQPHTAIVLNVGPTHLERLGSMEAIASAKGEAVEALSSYGTAVLNADDSYVAAMADKTMARVLTFGIEKHATIRATDIKSHGLAGVDFKMHAPGREMAVHSPLPGASLVYNALAAITVAFDMGFSVEEATFALSQVEAPGRLRALLSSTGAMVLDDSYNAGPASMLAALSVLSETPGRRIALLGDMLELGSEEAEGHRKVGERAGAVADLLFTVGTRGRSISDAARASGAVKVSHFESKESALKTLRELLRPGDVLLVKASHGIGLHTVVEGLVPNA